MNQARTRRLALTTAALGAALGLSACGTGLSAQTNAVYQASVGADQRQGDFESYNTIIVANGDDSWSLTAALLNTTDDAGQLVSYTVAPLGGGQSISAKPDKPVSIKAGALTTIGYEGEAIFDSSDLVNGEYAVVSLNFSNGSTTEIETPILPRTGDLEEIVGGPVETSSAEQSAVEDASAEH